MRHFTLFLLLSAALLLQGCASSATPDAGERPQTTTREEAINEDYSDLTRKDPSKPVTVKMSPEAVARKNQMALEDLNQQIEVASAKAKMMERSVIKREGYKLGPNDVIEISVFMVEELNKTARVTGDGFILLPLVGALLVEGKTVQEVQGQLTKVLGEKYLQDPQVTVFITEYRSHQVAVLGAVKNPDIYNIQRPRTVLEMVSMAGGLSEEAGNRIRIQRGIIDKETGELAEEALIIDLRPLIEGLNSEAEMLLSGGDSIMVPKAGTVFLEGSVVKPGAYSLRGGTTVLKALSMAGGVRFEADQGSINVFRQRSDGEMDTFALDLEEIRKNPQLDIELIDSDIVVISKNKLKQGMAYFWDGLTSIFRVGTSL